MVNYNTKQCSKCKVFFDMTERFFYRNKKRKDGFQNFCKSCQKEYAKNYHKETYGERKLNDNRKSREYFDKNPEYRKEYYQKNKAKHKEYTKKWYQQNKEKHRQLSNKWRMENKEQFNIIVRRYQHKKRSVKFNFTENDWNVALNHFGNKCAYCGKNGKLQKEHVIPVSKNGPFIPSNVIPACASCNVSKLDKDLDDWFVNQKFFTDVKLRNIRNFLTERREGQIEFFKD